MIIYHLRVGKGVSYRIMASDVKRAQSRNPFSSLFAKKDNLSFRTVTMCQEQGNKRHGVKKKTDMVPALWWRKRGGVQ